MPLAGDETLLAAGHTVTPAKAGVSVYSSLGQTQIPAFAGIDAGNLGTRTSPRSFHAVRRERCNRTATMMMTPWKAWLR